MNNERKAILAKANARFEAAYAALPTEKKSAQAVADANRKFNRFMSKKSSARTAAMLGQ